MPNNDHLIPPPSIGESAGSRLQSQPAEPRKSKLWIVIVGCIVVGVGLGVFVYQQSIAPSPSAPKPSVTPKPVTIPTPSPIVPEINQVVPQSKNITFPKAGEVRVYMAGYDNAPTYPNWLIRLTGTSGLANLKLPATVPAGDKMSILNSGLTVAAGESVKIESFDYGDTAKPSFGWIKPDAANKCGTTYPSDPAPLIAWATQKAQGQPLVSIQCWADWGPSNDTSNGDYNDFLVILSYVPPSGASTAPTPSATVTPSRSPSASPIGSPSPASSKSPSPSPSQSKSPTPSKSPSATPAPSTIASVTPTPTPRAAMPEGSALPEAGIFEVTVGTVGVGLVFVILGALGLLLL